MQERRNSIANALELRLSCTKPSQYHVHIWYNRCDHSLAAVTPVKYEHDLKTLTYNFITSYISITEKLTYQILVTPTPERLWKWAQNNHYATITTMHQYDALKYTWFHNELLQNTMSNLSYNYSSLKFPQQITAKHKWVAYFTPSLTQS